MLQFKNEALNQAYKINIAEDVSVNLPGKDTQGNVIHKPYRGKISLIPSADMLEGLLARKSNIIRRIEPKAPSGKNTPTGNDTNTGTAPAAAGDTATTPAAGENPAAATSGQADDKKPTKAKANQ